MKTAPRPELPRRRPRRAEDVPRRPRPRSPARQGSRQATPELLRLQPTAGEPRSSAPPADQPPVNGSCREAPPPRRPRTPAARRLPRKPRTRRLRPSRPPRPRRRRRPRMPIARRPTGSKSFAARHGRRPRSDRARPVPAGDGRRAGVEASPQARGCIWKTAHDHRSAHPPPHDRRVAGRRGAAAALRRRRAGHRRRRRRLHERQGCGQLPHPRHGRARRGLLRHQHAADAARHPHRARALGVRRPGVGAGQERAGRAGPGDPAGQPQPRPAGAHAPRGGVLDKLSPPAPSGPRVPQSK